MSAGQVTLFQRMLDVNLFGTVHAAQAVLSGMKARGFGRIIATATASTAGQKGEPYVSAYCAAKHAVVGIVRSLRRRPAAASPSTRSVSASPTPTSSATA